MAYDLQNGEADFDVSPLQKAFLTLAAKVDQCARENAALRAEVAELRVAKRLEALEQGLQELADAPRPTGLYWNQSRSGRDDARGGWARTESTVGGLRAALASSSGMTASGAAGAAGPAAAAAVVSLSGERGGSGGGRAGAAAAAASGGAATAGGGAVSAGPGSLSGAAAGAGGTGGAVVLPGSGGSVGLGGLGGGAAAGEGGMPAGALSPISVVPAVPGVGLDESWLVEEMMALRERLTSMERKSEALWHAQEDDEQLRTAVERLRQDVINMQRGVAEAQTSAGTAAASVERQANATNESVIYVKDLQERMHGLEMAAMKSSEERREMTSKYESSIGQIWDQLRHVEGSLAQRLTMAETSHVAALQEVDEAKEATNEVLQRVDDVKRHVSALEGKLESFNTQVAAAINPLHNALAAASERLDGLAASKQDAAAAIKHEDVELGVARAIEHADRRGDNLLKAIAGLDTRLEALADSTPNKGEVVLTCDLEALLTAHAHELDLHLDRLKGEMMAGVAAKVDREELASLDSRMASRLDGLEGALLRGLRAISDKVSAALSEKLDLVKFNEFKLQVRAILADVEDRLRDWSPLAFGTKASLGTDPLTAGAPGAATCLCCDSRVRTVRDLKAMGFREDDRVFAPDRIPLSDPLLPSIQGNRAASLGAHLNARLNSRVATAEARLRLTNSLMESLPNSAAGGGGGGMHGGGDSRGSLTIGSPNGSGGGPGGMAGTGSSAGGLAAAVDAASFAVLPPQPTREERLASAGAVRQASARGIKVKVETVSGGIMKGQLPNRQMTPTGGGGGGGGGPVAGSGAAAAARGPRTPVAAAATANGVPSHLVVMGNGGSVSAAAAAAGAAAVAAAVQGHDVGVPRPMSPWRADTPGGGDMEPGPFGYDGAVRA